MIYKAAKALVEQHLPELRVDPADRSEPRKFVVKMEGKQTPFSMMLPEGDDEIASAQFLSLLYNARLSMLMPSWL